MPQLDFSTYFSQFFWLVITFLLLFLFLSKLYLPKILDIFELRSKTISENIKAAHLAKEQAACLKKEYEEMVANATKTRSNKLEEVNKEIFKMIESKLLKQENELNYQLSQAEERIKNFETKSSDDVSLIAKLAVKEIVSSLGLNNFTQEQVDIVIEKVKQEEKYVI